MIDLFLKLIDRCIALVKRREETDRNMYTDFIASSFADFEAVHKNYLDSFQKYRDMIMNPELVLDARHPVVDTISKDGLFSTDLRSKISVLYDLKTDSLAGKFIEAIFNYVEFASKSNPLTILMMESAMESVLYNFIRGAFTNSLDKVFRAKLSQDKKRELALKHLDQIVERIQVNHSAVIREHAALKRKLLRAR
jgi:transcriptional regulator of acetoin/glycerol metabolism